MPIDQHDECRIDEVTLNLTSDDKKWHPSPPAKAKANEANPSTTSIRSPNVLARKSGCDTLPICNQAVNLIRRSLLDILWITWEVSLN